MCKYDTTISAVHSRHYIITNSAKLQQIFTLCNIKSAFFQLTFSSLIIQGPFINYVTVKGGGSVQCDMEGSG